MSVYTSGLAVDGVAEFAALHAALTGFRRELAKALADEGRPKLFDGVYVTMDEAAGALLDKMKVK